jgi:hypothetical protein
MPAWAEFRIIWQILSISRVAFRALASMMLGFSLRVM